MGADKISLGNLDKENDGSGEGMERNWSEPILESLHIRNWCRYVIDTEEHVYKNSLVVNFLR